MNAEGDPVFEPGRFDIMIGCNSADTQSLVLDVK